MKKIYQAPVTEEIKIAFKQQMLAGSDPNAGLNPNEEITDPSIVVSREGNSIFDDDEDY